MTNPCPGNSDAAHTAYTYDVRNMVATVATGPSSTTADSRYSYEYDSRGLRSAMVKPNLNRVAYTYYEDRLLRISDERTSDERGKQIVARHILDYDADGQKIWDSAKVDQAGTTDTRATLDQRSDFAYTPAGQIASVTNTGADKGENESYVYDAAGNTTSQTIGSVTTTMAYDRNRLTSTTSGGTTAYRRYDHYGRLVTVDQSDVIVERYSYDGFDRTVREQKFSAAGALQLDKTQTFDPFDRTVSQTTAITGKPTKSLRFTYLGTSDQVAVEEEKNTAGAWAVAKNYAYGPDGTKLQLTNTPVNDTTKNETQYYGTNPHGDVESLTTTDGSAKSTYRYTAYGQPDKKGTTGEDAYSTSTDAPTRMAEDLDSTNSYRFTGKRIHGGTGSYDIGFRDYNPGINRYLTRDFYQGALKDLALGTDPWSTNRYAYAGGNPIGFTDLDGHEPRPWHEQGQGFEDSSAEEVDDYGAGLYRQDASAIDNPSGTRDSRVADGLVNQAANGDGVDQLPSTVRDDPSEADVIGLAANACGKNLDNGCTKAVLEILWHRYWDAIGGPSLGHDRGLGIGGRVGAGAESATDSTGPWLRGTEGNAGRIPASVRGALEGKSFSSWEEFRGAFWKAAAGDAKLAGQFSASNRALMAKGQAPFVRPSQTFGSRTRYELHHITPRSRGGAVYDLDNLVVVTPRYHAEILDGSYHFGGGIR